MIRLTPNASGVAFPASAGQYPMVPEVHPKPMANGRVALAGLAAWMWGAACLLFLSAHFLKADDEFLVQSWQTDDGLPHSSITAIAQTPDGYLWIGTYNGLARFDGVRFTVFDPGNTPALATARVAWLGVDAFGTLWISTEDGSLALCEAGQFHPVRVEGGGNIQAKLLVSSGTNEVLLLGRSGRLYRRVNLEGDQSRLIPLGAPGGTNVKDVARDREGHVWCLHAGKLGRWWAGQFEDSLEPPELKGLKIHSLEADEQGRIWLGTDRGLGILEAGQFQDRTPTNGGPDELTYTRMNLSGPDGAWVMVNGQMQRCVARQWVADAGPWSSKFEPPGRTEERMDRRGTIWVAHYGSGVLRVGTNGQERWFKTRDGFPGERASCTFEDREGNIWVGLNRAGLVRVRERRFRVLGMEEGLRERVAMSVCEDREGAIWIGTFGGGLHRWADGLMEAFNVGASQPNIVVSVFPTKDGPLWLGTGGDGVLGWENGHVVEPPFGPGRPSNGHAILEDSQGRTWIGNAIGLFRWAGGKLQRFGAKQGFRASSARAFAEDATGAVWIGASDGAIYRCAGEQFTEFHPADALGRQPVWTLLAERDGTLWAGTFRGGLLRFKDGYFTRCTTRDGLANDVICHILDDDSGHLWLGSHGGILRLSKAALHAFCDGTQKSVACAAYGKSDGLPTVECSGNYQPAGWRARDGRLWFATVKGAVSVQPREVTMNPQPPPVVIEDLLVDGKSEAHNSMSANIGPGRHYVEFRYSGLSFAAPDKVRFKHQLEGLEKVWVEDGVRREAKYSYIPPGNYRFRVLACNNDGVWNQTGAALALTVLPFFWQTAWFAVVVGLCGMLTVAVTVRYLSRRKLKLRLAALEQQHAIEKERSRIARDIHDDLGASLTQVALLGEMAERGAGEPGEVRARSRRISTAAREMARTLEAIVWAVRPENDTLPSLVGYLDRRTDELLDSAPLRYRFEAPRDLPACVVSAEVRHNVFLAFKEALTNALKHSGATELHITVTMESGTLHLAIADNGKGFEPSKVREDGNGVSNMRRRMKDIGGEFDLQTGNTKGTTVRLRVQIETAPPSAG